MSLRKRSDTWWTLVFANGDYNSSMEIEATKEGLEIDGDLLPWAEIDEARKRIENTPEQPPGM